MEESSDVLHYLAFIKGEDISPQRTQRAQRIKRIKRTQRIKDKTSVPSVCVLCGEKIPELSAYPFVVSTNQ